MSFLFDALHRKFFGALSLADPRGQGRLLQRYFDWWHRKPDPWSHSTDEYELYKYGATLKNVPDRPYRRILDAGCSEGTFTHQVAGQFPDTEIIGVDISERAIERARAAGENAGDSNEQAASSPAFKVLDILNEDPGGPFDLIFCAETLYYLGRSVRLRRASERLATLLAPEGLLVLVHPWPEARRLYRFFDSDPRLTRLDEHIDEAKRRAFAVTHYQRRAHSR